MIYSRLSYVVDNAADAREEMLAPPLPPHPGYHQQQVGGGQDGGYGQDDDQVCQCSTRDIIITGTFLKVFVFTYFAILMHLHSRYIEVIH